MPLIVSRGVDLLQTGSPATIVLLSGGGAVLVISWPGP